MRWVIRGLNISRVNCNVRIIYYCDTSGRGWYTGIEDHWNTLESLKAHGVETKW